MLIMPSPNSVQKKDYVSEVYQNSGFIVSDNPGQILFEATSPFLSILSV